MRRQDDAARAVAGITPFPRRISQGCRRRRAPGRGEAAPPQVPFPRRRPPRPADYFGVLSAGRRARRALPRRRRSTRGSRAEPKRPAQEAWTPRRLRVVQERNGTTRSTKSGRSRRGCLKRAAGACRRRRSLPTRFSVAARPAQRGAFVKAGQPRTGTTASTRRSPRASRGSIFLTLWQCSPAALGQRLDGEPQTISRCAARCETRGAEWAAPQARNCNCLPKIITRMAAHASFARRGARLVAAFALGGAENLYYRVSSTESRFSRSRSNHRSSRLRIRSPETPGPHHAKRSAHEHR